ncbi:hypothetical protein EHEL_090770 [Encephalitozoon hellem ATCC 50504]|uniref:THUMP domain-containing protein n=1 Tax=Encephalitozoon hellem TaxID=27973 RepID=A0A9Q9FA52_ENCHE|nr:uncharacterized protein EHEL_090770 [Encephalitozoon hellem ATCC 50504]AFM98972.1 hypothetical protein EHEL_090770 [Encephalitozoon hellem ATCC 50504]UTX43986.1 hypothetical protein GPU96_09g17660 [Encephalitozoon hellem]WEL39471.1 hypothetical protein PFJ87_09g00990 [Encephalitozoon hellem]|eukprot:XP_003887953.1 hypothetical protein EHEL_090770 [Encephalitozoon hellem ATCC 50504]
MRTGFFVSCRLNKESKGLREVTGKLQGLVEPPRKNSEEKSIRRILEEEIEEYKSCTQFTKHDGYRCVLLLENRSTETSLSLFYKLRASGTRFEYVHRIVPLDNFFQFDEEKILESIGRLDENKSYRIMYEGRLCHHEMKKKVFDLITKSISLRVDLESPHYIIAVQAFKGNLGVSVVEGEKENFNFSAI